MNEVKQYQLVYAYQISDFNTLVNERISQGWQPIGSASILNNNKKIGLVETTGFMMAQTMVKYE
ncbi:MAG: DUF1737 domain-containing protein [Flavipsychrobacter sp.]|nr:DUF1737 domain-containing protein [Flavipsychrobacter sp.]